MGRADWRAAAMGSIGPEDAVAGDPVAKTAKISVEAEDIHQLHESVKTVARLNILRTRDSILRSSASGIWRLGLFCDLTLGKHYPADRGNRAW